MFECSHFALSKAFTGPPFESQHRKLIQSPPCACILSSSPGFDDFHLSIHSDMATVAKAMACPESGLEVRDRMWLKITIANAFIGTSVRAGGVVRLPGVRSVLITLFIPGLSRGNDPPQLKLASV